MDTATTNRVQVQQMLDAMFKQGHLFVGRVSSKGVGINGEDGGAIANSHAQAALILRNTSPKTEQEMTVKRFLLEQTDNSIFENPRRVLWYSLSVWKTDQFSVHHCEP
jgi:hypothetical protein